MRASPQGAAESWGGGVSSPPLLGWDSYCQEGDRGGRPEAFLVGSAKLQAIMGCMLWAGQARC